MAISRILVVDDSPTERFFCPSCWSRTVTWSAWRKVVKKPSRRPSRHCRPDRDGCRDAGNERLSGDRMISKEMRPSISRSSCAHQRSGNRQGVGHAPGRESYLVKPVKPEDLLSQIKALD